MRALAVLLPRLLVNGHADAKCAPSSVRAAVATPAGTAIPDGGGIVVFAESFYDGGKIATGDVAVQKGWKRVQGKLAVEPTIDVWLAVEPTSDVWVDAMGRESPPSKPVAITGKKVDVGE